jgi:hypothetical protein
MSASRQRRLLVLGGALVVLPAFARAGAPRIGFRCIVPGSKETIWRSNRARADEVIE